MNLCISVSNIKDQRFSSKKKVGERKWRRKRVLERGREMRKNKNKYS
jgi:hypothetical protein